VETPLPAAFVAARAAVKEAETRVQAARADYHASYAAASAIQLTDAQCRTLFELVAAEDHAAAHATCGCNLAS
jgi:hypothetical protein